tara:strand:- start:27795 stop:28073 length:279 start_codon:yes stop_codon:yes gene_type:complete
MNLFSAETTINGVLATVNLRAFNQYGSRVNIKRDDVLVEELFTAEELTDKDLTEFEDEVYWQISNEEGEWYDRFTKLVRSEGLSEVCVVGKY